MSERMKFVSRILDGEKMSDLCREFEISRKTGYKIYNRFRSEGIMGLEDKSRSARNRPNQTPRPVERSIIELRIEHPSWGAPKIKAYLERRFPKSTIPACSTIHAILHRQNLIKKKRRFNTQKLTGTDFSPVNTANQLWCTDFKGQFKMRNKQYCYPLTISDQYSRYLIACEALENTKEDACIEIFDRVFQEYGLPNAIRSDNGVPFGTRSFFGLSRLNVYWLRLGIKLERIEPGCPEQNGRHERMHRTLKEETTKPPSSNLLSQQEKFDAFRETYNKERPHQALNMKSPADLYEASRKKFNPFLDPLEYPDHENTHQVSLCGSVHLKNKKRLYIGEPFGGQNVGIKRVEEDIWKITFMSYDLGFFDLDNPKIQLAPNPFLIRTET